MHCDLSVENRVQKAGKWKHGDGLRCYPIIHLRDGELSDSGGDHADGENEQI